MNITVLDAITLGNDIDVNVFSNYGSLTVYQQTEEEEVAERLQTTDIAITNKVYIGKAIMDVCPNLKLICISATGMNNVDLPYAAKKNIVVKNVAGYSTQSVAQFTFATLLSFIHRLPYYDQFAKSGKYTDSRLFTHINHGFGEIASKTYGIIGLGNIGRKVAEVATVFGANVIYYSTSGKNTTNDYKQVNLEELFIQSDYISVHCPLNEQTNNLITKAQLSKAKESLVISNMGRGGIINEADLAQAIDGKLIAGAIIDVFTAEPLTKENPLFNVKNKERLLLTPHIAWASVEARQLLIKKLEYNIETFLNGEG